MVNVNQHFLLIDARLIRRSSSFRSIPEVGGRAFKNKGSTTNKKVGSDGQNLFVKCTVNIACSGRVVDLEERRLDKNLFSGIMS